VNLFQQMVVDKLKALGGSVDGVRKSLAKAKITGSPQEAQSCPLANYLREEFNIEEVEVSQGEITVDGVALRDGDVPKVFSTFITGFDQRDFPELINPDELTEDEEEALKLKRKKKK
jgi:hypothetical protein